MILVSIAGWLIGQAASLAAKTFGGGVVDKVLDVFNQNQDGRVKIAKIDADTGIALSDQSYDFADSQQKAKMNWPVFWVLITAMIGAPALLLWGVTLYNIFWHANGIWPQTWDIAAYPPSVATWVEKSIDWLYNPVGVPGTIAAALVAGRVTR